MHYDCPTPMMYWPLPILLRYAEREKKEKRKRKRKEKGKGNAFKGFKDNPMAKESATPGRSRLWRP